MKVLVLGASGVLGRNVIPRLVEEKHQVRAVVRRADQIPFWEQMGVETKLGDILDRVSLEDAVSECDVVLHLATAIPKSESQDWSNNDRVRREGTRNLLDAAISNGVQRYIQQSITLLYGEQGQMIATEVTPLQVTSISASAADMEAMVQSSNLDWSILRGGIFYGAGTGREDGWRKDIEQGQIKLPGDGSDLISLVHVVDFARAVVAAVTKASAGGIYNIVDDEPVSFQRLFNHLAKQLGVEPPSSNGYKFLPSLGCSNTKARNDLKWQPAFSSYRAGLASFRNN